MAEMNCLIIEDEPLATGILEDYIRDTPGLKLIGSCPNAQSATDILSRTKADLLFVDIQLPGVNGLDFIRNLNNRPFIILTTAYHQYAIEAFDLNVIDYLLKPIEFKRFLQAISKVHERQLPAQADPERESVFFTVDKKKVRIYLDEIVFVESLKDYVRIQTEHKKIVTKFQIGELEKMLGSDSFLRVHKSFIVNRAKINSISASQVEAGTFQIPIGRKYRELTKKIPDA